MQHRLEHGAVAGERRVSGRQRRRAAPEQTCVEPGEGPRCRRDRWNDAEKCGTERHSVATERTWGSAAERGRGDRARRVRVHLEVVPGGDLSGERAGLAAEDVGVHRQEGEGEDDQRIHPEQHRRPEEAVQRVGEPQSACEPLAGAGEHLERDGPDPVQRRGQPDRGGDHHDPLHDEDGHAGAIGDAGQEREHPDAPDQRPHRRHRGRDPPTDERSQQWQRAQQCERWTEHRGQRHDRDDTPHGQRDAEHDPDRCRARGPEAVPMVRHVGQVAQRLDDVEVRDPDARDPHGHHGETHADERGDDEVAGRRHEAQRERAVASFQQAGGRTRHQPGDARPHERPDERRRHGVAGAFEGEDPDQVPALQPGGPGETELTLALLGEHHEQVHQQQHPGEHAERADPGVELTERTALVAGPGAAGRL